MKFNEKLVLNSYIFSLFGVKDLDELSKSFKDDTRLEGVDEEGVSLFYYSISSMIFEDTPLDKIKLLEYDSNIVRHTKNLKQPIKWKYFQYLTLLFTEIYLDMYSASKGTLLDNLNIYLEKFNKSLPKKEKIKPFELSSLNKLAFWNATGSGKTFLMHINIMQFKHYNKLKINKTILITPNAGLSKQHLKEFDANGFEAELFSEDSRGLFEKDIIEVLEISKLKEQRGETTFAVESFGNDNLVFIDEGHRGAKGEEWKNNRDALSANGFAFEYSATFGQAIGSATPKKRDELTDEYSKSILFDYSYKFFKNDGFGKDYTILNLKEEVSEELKYNYLVGSLLSFYQQKKIFIDNPKEMNLYNIENPLMIFVGGKVTQTLSKDEGSDITNVLEFLQKFVSQKELTKSTIQKILNYNSGISTSSTVDIFTNKFAYLSSLDIDAGKIYTDILEIVFNSNGGVLHIEELKGSDGEIGLKIGESEYFGVINIGDVAKFIKLCQSLKLNVSNRDFSQSLFLELNDKKSKINILIGSRKFSEGWSSWRVSTMGLLNMGKSEGSQVIQLFGRGVRLKGRDMSLKRSSYYGKDLEVKYISCERLNIFGLKANYMDEFRKYLENEGVDSSEMFDISLPVIRDDRYKNKKLKVLRLKEGKRYKENKIDNFKCVKNDAITKKVVINFYAKAQVIGVVAGVDYAQKTNIYRFDKRELVFIDANRLFLELLKYKNEKSYLNLNIYKKDIEDFLQNSDWYTLEAPNDYFKISTFKDFEKIQDAFTILLRKYLDEFYKYHKNSYEKDFMEYQELKDNDANFVDNYQISCEVDENSDLIQRLQILKSKLDNNDLTYNIELSYFKSFVSAKHLYNPLLFKEQKKIKISPIELNDGEIKFVQDLEKYLSENGDRYKDSEIFLLRNKSKVGIGFFEDGGFYPDFIMWILKDAKQYISFIDPKGIRNLDLSKNKKINFYKSIKEKEKFIGDEETVLNSFIVSNTSYDELINIKESITKIELENKNVLFQKDDKNYISKLFDKMVG